ncbi:hypothetical protein PBI_GRAY_96 [Gordonia phage Gray]|nr:hypothetical protein PBI_GRAY_96 [Gordonia phage Gray]
MDRVKKYMALKKPCADCPFVKSVNFPLGITRRHEIADSLGRGETFPCHKTVTYDDDGYARHTGGESRCFGAASVLHKGGDAPMQAEQVAVRLGIADPPYDDQLETDRTYDSLNEFVLGDPEWWRDPDDDAERR